MFTENVEEEKVIYSDLLGEYTYYDMKQVIAAALGRAECLLQIFLILKM